MKAKDKICDILHRSLYSGADVQVQSYMCMWLYSNYNVQHELTFASLVIQFQCTPRLTFNVSLLSLPQASGVRLPEQEQCWALAQQIERV